MPPDYSCNASVRHRIVDLMNELSQLVGASVESGEDALSIAEGWEVEAAALIAKARIALERSSQ